MELISSPQNSRYVSLATSKQDVPVRVSFQRIDAMESSVLSVPSKVDQLCLIIEGHCNQEGISVFESPFLGSTQKEDIPLYTDLAAKPSSD